MWAADRRKEQEKTCLRNDIQRITANVINISNEVHVLTAALNQAIGGSPSGMDAKLTGVCQNALQEISGSLQQLNSAYRCVNQLDVMKWTDEGGANDFY